MSDVNMLGYEDNLDFLRNAPVGTKFYFNNEKHYWERRQNGVWYASSSDNPLRGMDWDEESGWEINRITFATREDRDAHNGLYTNDQAQFIVRNLHAIMDAFADSVVNGAVPESSDIFWMDKIVKAVENGAQLKRMGE